MCRANGPVRPLAGDINRDGQVTTADASLIKPHYQELVTAREFLGMILMETVLITTADVSLVKPRYQHVAPTCP